jgi:hypothetical protein
MGHPIHVDELRRFLQETEFRVRDLTYSPRIADVIEARQAEFAASIRRTLIQGSLIPRPETAQLYSAITQPKGTRIHCLHGGGGQGKSCILHELTQLLTREAIPFLPLRFDVYPPRSNTRAYGQLLEFPESPVKCLHALVGDRLGVMIIDQLDALRWTPQHDPSAWIVFERLVTEAMQLSTTIHVVFACRSFDLENDPQIRPWREQEKVRSLLGRVFVGDLPASHVEKVVEKTGGSWDTLNGGQRRLLERPQCLYLWTNLPSEPRSAFRTATDLMRAFWRDVRFRLENMGLVSTDVEHALGTLAARLDQDGASTVPVTILDRWQTIRDALESLNVIEEVHGRKLRFAHQSYFDYYLADIWLARLRQKGATITVWLKATDDQSLLRRGQLRQLLAVLRDDDPTRFLTAVCDLLHDPGIRFHLQHLTLQFLGSLPDPTPAEVASIVALLEEKGLRQAVSSQVLYGHLQWFDAFDKQGIWAQWIASDESWKGDIAAQMLRSIATQCGDRAAQLLLPHADRPAPWPERIRSILPWSGDQDTGSLFDLRLRLLPNSVPIRPDYLFTEQLAQREPTWLIKLLARLLSLAQRDSHDRESEILARGEPSPYWPSHHASAAIRLIANAAPALFWETIIPFVISAVAEYRSQPHDWEHPVFEEDALWQHDLWRYEHLGGEPLPAFLALAGGRWAHTDTGAVLAAIASIDGSPFQTIQQLVGTVWLYGPDSVADHALRWLMEDHRRFCLGRLGTKQYWRLARDLVLRFATLCTDAVYQQLELELMSGDPAREQEHLKNMLRSHLIGRSKIGFLRHALLPALPESRRSLAIVNAIGQLKEKFRQPADELDRDMSGRGGLVISPITPRSARLSDSAWLRLITSPDAPPQHKHRRYKQSHVIESSPEMFARDLGQQADQEPVRFANLARRVPPDASQRFWCAFLQSLALTQPPDQATRSWQAATDEQCRDVLGRVGFSADPGVAMAFARCIRARHMYPWPDDLVSILCRIASNHSHPQEDNAVIGGDADDRLDGEAMSTARGCAAEALATVIFQRRAVSPDVRSAIEHLVTDPVPAIRVAAIGTLIPVLNIDREQAAAWFLRACDGTLDQVLASHNAQRFMSYTISTNTQQFDDIMNRMHRSTRAAVAEAGAQWTTLVWLYVGGRKSFFHECVVGSVVQRKGVADVLARHVYDERVASKCQEWLPRFLDDCESDVRAPATGFLRKAPNIAAENVVSLLRAFVASRAFRAEAHQLVWELERYGGDLRPLATVIFEACDRLTEEVTDPIGRHVHSIDVLGDLSVFLLRLYGLLEPPNDDPHLRKKCLDHWDNILRHGNYIPAQVASFLD